MLGESSSHLDIDVWGLVAGVKVGLERVGNDSNCLLDMGGQ